MTTPEPRASRWKYIHHEGTKLRDIGVNPDGSLHNPNDYPPDVVRAAVASAEERTRKRRSEAAKQAAETRRARQARHVYDAARRIVAGEIFGPRDSCYICGRGLDDPESKQRGIGSDCWQFILDAIRITESA
jgi:hypothetical protein